MDVDERRADEAAGGVDLARSSGRQLRLDGGDPRTAHPDIDARAPVGQVGVAEDQVELHRGLGGWSEDPESAARIVPLATVGVANKA